MTYHHKNNGQNQPQPACRVNFSRVHHQRDNEGRHRLLTVCVRLHNIRCSCAGVNQLLSVFEAAWKADGEACYNDFSTLLFSDIVHRDRVGRFYNLPLQYARVHMLA